MDLTSTSATSRFRFRDHTPQLPLTVDNYSSESHTTADSSSISSNEDDDNSELQSMSAKGVQHLCSELLELKQESDEDFRKHIFSNYSAFIAILKEIPGLQNEVSRLKNQAFSHKSLVKEINEEIYPRVYSEETIESPILEEEPSLSLLETHTENISEILDTLVSEQRFDDALGVLEMEGDFFRNLETGSTFSSGQLMSYDSVISENRAMISDQFILVAKHPRTSALELHKALLGLCQLGQNHISTDLLFQYYHTRISSGIRNLQSSRELLDVLYMLQVAKYFFSMISQAARSFVTLNGENEPNSSDFIQWACDEIGLFAACFVKYIESIFDISGRLSTTVHAVQISMSYCSLLESQKISLLPYLIENIRPCIEDVLQSHIDHLSIVVNIFTLNDTWELGRYFTSEILIGRSSAIIIHEQPEYFFLTNSGRRFVTMFQSVAEDLSPLIAMQMESLVLKGFIDLFKSYIALHESALLSSETNMIGKGVLILANLSTTTQFTSSIIKNIFYGIRRLDFEIDNHLLFAEDVYGRLKSDFLEQFISNIFCGSGSHESCSESCIIWQEDSTIYDLIPSVPYLELYSELNKLRKLAEYDFVDANWLIDLLEEIMDATFEWISRKSDIWTINMKNIAVHRTESVQFVLDIQFLVEIARSGNYLSDEVMVLSKDIVSRVRQLFITAGLPPLADINDDEWIVNAAVRALHKLQEHEAKDSKETENSYTSKEESTHNVAQASGDLQFEVNDDTNITIEEAEVDFEEHQTDGATSPENSDF